MTQTRTQSAVEGAVNTVLGFAVACAGNVYFGLPVRASFTLTVVLTVISFIRGYIVRRVFAWWDHR